MTPEQIRLVQTSFEQVRPIADTVAELFYARLFELDPSLRHLFEEDVKAHGRSDRIDWAWGACNEEQLMSMIGEVVVHLDHLDQIIPAVQTLGMRYAHYGIEDTHYETVGAALVWTLEMGLGENFTSDTQIAWVEVCNLLTNMIKEACSQNSEQQQVPSRFA